MAVLLLSVHALLIPPSPIPNSQEYACPLPEVVIVLILWSEQLHMLFLLRETSAFMMIVNQRAVSDVFMETSEPT